jgi:hypothetical protein
MADGDEEGKKYTSKAVDYFKMTDDEIKIRIHKLSYNDIEHEFWYNNFRDFIIDNVPKQQKYNFINALQSNDVSIVKQIIKAACHNAGGKPAFAKILADEVNRRGKDSIPQTINNIITQIVKLAKE